jgi:hypothetical protein
VSRLRVLLGRRSGSWQAPSPRFWSRPFGRFLLARSSASATACVCSQALPRRVAWGTIASSPGRSPAPRRPARSRPRNAIARVARPRAIGGAASQRGARVGAGTNQSPRAEAAHVWVRQQERVGALTDYRGSCGGEVGVLRGRRVLGLAIRFCVTVTLISCLVGRKRRTATIASRDSPEYPARVAHAPRGAT